MKGRTSAGRVIAVIALSVLGTVGLEVGGALLDGQKAVEACDRARVVQVTDFHVKECERARTAYRHATESGHGAYLALHLIPVPLPLSVQFNYLELLQPKR